MRRGLAIVAAGLLTLSAAQAASAHETSRFRACTVHHVPGSCFTIGAAFVYGNSVKVRAVAEPVHAGYEARVQRRDPHSQTWARVGAVTVSAAGRMRYVWRTRYGDAVQDAPYLFRFRIPGHGKSNKTEAYVLFGE